MLLIYIYLIISYKSNGGGGGMRVLIKLAVTSVLFNHCVHFKLGHRFHALLKVCSDCDDIATLTLNTPNHSTSNSRVCWILMDLVLSVLQHVEKRWRTATLSAAPAMLYKSPTSFKIMPPCLHFLTLQCTFTTSII